MIKTKFSGHNKTCGAQKFGGFTPECPRVHRFCWLD